ncbi:hypothetical protein [Streptomyces sp. SID8499]|nr:hypothetical protein [Streptomyces sp. SID8499]
MTATSVPRAVAASTQIACLRSFTAQSLIAKPIRETAVTAFTTT